MSVNDYRKQQRPDPWDSARELTNDLERLIASIPQPVQQHSGNTDSAGRDWLAIARKHGYALPDKRMCGFVADLLAAREPAPVARVLDTDPITDFQEGQWWVAELDAMAQAEGATDDQKRAVAVVHHMLRAARGVARDLDVEAERREYEKALSYLMKNALLESGFDLWLAARRTAPAPVRTEQAAGAPGCGCRTCNPNMLGRMMFLCPACGDKRCPRAADHDLKCQNDSPVGAKEQDNGN